MNNSVLSAFVVNPQRIGGVEMYCRELSKQLAEIGWKHMMAFTAEPPPPVREFLGTPVEVRAEMSAADIEVLVRRHHPRITHLHFIQPVSAYPWRAKLAGARTIYITDHISRPEGAIPGLANAGRRLAGRLLTAPITRMISVSEFNAQAARVKGLIAPEKIVRIYNGVDLTRTMGDGAVFRAQFSIPSDRRVVLQASWMIPEKGLPDFLACARLVLAQRSDVHFVLVGEGAQRQQYMREAGLGGHITWTGMVDDPLARGVFAAADVVCQMSRWQEAFGWTITEAMTCSRPLVATRVGGIPEIVEDGVTGFLVPPGQPEAAADRILRLLHDTTLSARMGAAGRSAVETKFCLRANVAELVEMYRN